MTIETTYDFYANGYKMTCHSPVRTAFKSEADDSSHVVTGWVIGETPDGRPYKQSCVITKRALLSSMKSSIRYQRKYYGERPPALIALMDIRSGKRDWRGEEIRGKLK